MAIANIKLAMKVIRWAVERVGKVESNKEMLLYYLSDFKFCMSEATMILKDPFYLSRAEWDNYALLDTTETGLDVNILIPVGYNLSVPYVRLTVLFNNISTYDELGNLFGKDPSIAVSINGDIHYGKDYFDDDVLLITDNAFVYDNNPENEVLNFVKSNKRIIHILNQKHIKSAHGEYELTDQEKSMIQRRI